MSDLIEIIDNSFNFNNETVRIIGSFEEPWFIAKDVCSILGLSNVTEAIRHIPEKWRSSEILSTPSGNQNTNIINEAGLYKLIMRSNKKVAQKFQEWVCEEVLPSLRKKGEYKMKEEYQLKLKKLEEEKEEAENLLMIKDAQIKKLQRETQVVDGKNVCYLGTEDSKESEGIYTIGKTINLKKRLSDYNNNKLYNFKIVKYISCKSPRLMDAVEIILLSKLNKCKILSKRDVFQLPKDKDVYYFTQWFDYIKNMVEDIDEDIILEERTEKELAEILEEERELKSIYNKEYRTEHHEDILDREADFRDINREILRERVLDYSFNNRDVLNEKKRLKYAEDEEAKEKKKEYMKNYRKEKAEEIATSKRKYNKAHKEVLEQRIPCVCGSTVSRQNMPIHMLTDRHKTYVETGKTMDEQRKEEYIICYCGISVSKRGIKRHESSKLHLDFINSQKPIDI